MATKTKKKDCYCLSKEEYEAIMGKKAKAKPKKTVKKTASKPVKAKCTPCKATAPKKTAKTTSKARKTAKRKTAPKITVTKTKRNTNRNVNNNVVSVNVSSNPRAVSNVYLVTPPQMPAPVLEAPKKKIDRHVPYNAPFLRRRDGSAPRISTPRITNKTVYIDRPQAPPQVYVESASQQIPETVSKKGLITRLSGSKKAKQLPAPKQEVISAPKQEVLPAADSGYYLPSAREIQLENCESVKNPVEKAACKNRRRKAVSE